MSPTQRTRSIAGSLDLVGSDRDARARQHRRQDRASLRAAARVLRPLRAVGCSPLPTARTVRWHMGAIRLEAFLSTSGCHRGIFPNADITASCVTGAGEGTHAELLKP